jgi:hypothetical protein
MSLGSTPVPTCSVKLSPASLSRLMELLATEHFGDLPEILPKILMGYDGPWIDHEVIVKLGEVDFRRIYTSGKDISNELQPPPSFLAVEKAIEQFREEALKSASPCHFAAQWPSTRNN